METFRFLSSQSLAYNAEDAKGDDLISFASCGGSLDTLEAVLEMAGQPLYELYQPSGWTPLHWACRAGHANVVESLLARGLRSESIAASDLQGNWTPIAIAMFFGNKTMVEALKETSHSALEVRELDVYSTGISHSGYTCNGCLYASLYATSIHRD